MGNSLIKSYLLLLLIFQNVKLIIALASYFHGRLLLLMELFEPISSAWPLLGAWRKELKEVYCLQTISFL